MHNGIFYKFALDFVGLYGGDEFAQKAAGQELSGLRCYFEWAAQREGADMNLPLMLVVDAHGFRVIATSLLPLGEFTLRYGSDDGGRSVRASDQRLNEL